MHKTLPLNASAPASSLVSSSKEDASALRAVTIFPLLILVAGILGFTFPDVAMHITPHTSILLGVIMFGMGLTLTMPDFAMVFTHPLPIVIGVIAQYLIMPSLAMLVVWVMQLPPDVAIGVILVGCAPGGTASNVVSYLAKADVALSVTMTSVSTLLSPVVTPLLASWLIGQYVAVDGASMAMTIVKMVLVPVVGGVVIRLLIPVVVQRLLPALPWFSTAVIAVVVAGVVAPSHEVVRTAGVLVLVAVMLHNVLGFAVGYAFARLLRINKRAARTTSIEVGMQNSGMAATLATTYFSSMPAAALPGGIFSIWHNLSGAVLALIFRRLAERDLARFECEV